MKFILPIFALFLSAMVLAPSALALQLMTIGSSTVSSQTLSEWWYTSPNPTLTGTAAASSIVTITIDGTPSTVTADASGNWTYQPTLLTTGDHQVTIVGDGQTLTFTIHIGQTVPSTTTTASSSATLPVSGSGTQTLLLLGVGGLVLVTGLKLRTQTR